MKCFNIQRFKQLLKWTYRHDKHEWMHQVLSAVLGTSLCFAFIRLGVADSSETHFEIFPPIIAMFLIIDGVITASGMHYAMKTTDDWRSLTMLPASNLEKFLARYLSSITMAVGILLTIPVGDAVQYLTSLIYDAGPVSSCRYLPCTAFICWVPTSSVHASTRGCSPVSRSGLWEPLLQV